MHKNSQRTELVTAPSSGTVSSGIVARLSDAAAFWGVILLSAAAVAAIALATPLVLALAAVIGLVAGNKPHSTWRRARA